MAATIKAVNVENTMKSVSADKASVLIDVREDAEIKEIAAAISKPFPMSKINPATFEKDAGVTKAQPIYLICKSGGRSMRVATALAEAGFTNLTNVEGGTSAWVAAGLPVKKS